MNIENTLQFSYDVDNKNKAKKILVDVYDALSQKGYDPVRQLVGYLLSGDPTYITNHNNARSIISRLERDELLMELVKDYLKLDDKDCKA